MSADRDAAPVVMKFGGTSVRDDAAMRRVVAITAAERGRRPVVVTSACAGITDLLLECARRAGERRLDDALAVAAAIRERHHAIAAELVPDDRTCRCELDEMLEQIDRLVRGVLLVGELSPRTTDLFASFGERLASVLLTAAFRDAGWRAITGDSRTFIITDDAFTEARPLMAEIDRRTATLLAPLVADHDVVVVQGFIGSTFASGTGAGADDGAAAGVTTTIGRGGSDYTAALVGAALAAREIQIWTDVSGILTADPRIVAAARVVPEVTFTEARELAYFGAKVLHPDTIVPAVTRAIPVVIRNSMRPEDAGTRILPDGSDVAPGIHSIAIRRGMTLLRLAPRNPGDGFAPVERALALFAEHGVVPHCALLAESRALIVTPTADLHDILIAALEAACSVTAEPEIALLSLTGAALCSTPTAIAAALGALDGTTIAFTGAGTSDHLMLVGVAEQNAAGALARMHARLFE